MKTTTYTAFLIVLCTLFMFGQKKTQLQGLTISNKQFALTYSSQLLLEGKAATGSKERFGLVFKSTAGKNVFAEVLDASGKVVKSITVNEYLGSAKGSDVKITSNKVSKDGRTSETIHEFAAAGNSLKLVTRGLLSGDKANPSMPENIIVTFSLSGSTAQQYALRLQLSIEGSAEVKGNGVVVSGKAATSSIAVSVLPKVERMELQKNMLSITTTAVSVSGETPMVWLVASVVSGASVAASKTAAAVELENSFKVNQDPNLIIINTASKSDAQPGDTVTYTLTCKNIGMSDATNIVLSNPVPTGTSYIEGSASTNGAELALERESAPAPQTSTVKTVKWTLKDVLKSGKEFEVHFNVMIK